MGEIAALGEGVTGLVHISEVAMDYVKDMEEEMLRASRELRFEDAAKLRDKIKRLKAEE